MDLVLIFAAALIGAATFMLVGKLHQQLVRRRAERQAALWSEAFQAEALYHHQKVREVLEALETKRVRPTDHTLSTSVGGSQVSPPPRWSSSLVHGAGMRGGGDDHPES